MRTRGGLMRLYVIACDVVARPVYLCAARSPHVVDVRLFERGLHDEPKDLRHAPPGGDRRGAREPPTRSCWATGCAAARPPASRPATVPVVLPRAHDCITLFLGARERYAQETTDRPATYWYVADQLERNDGYQAGVGGLAIGADTDDQSRGRRAPSTSRSTARTTPTT